MLLVAVNLKTMFLMYFTRASHNLNNLDVFFNLFEQSTKKKTRPLNPLVQLYEKFYLFMIKQKLAEGTHLIFRIT